MALFGTAHGWRGGGSEAGVGVTFIPCLIKIQKLNELSDTLFQFCRHQYFFTRN